MSTAFRSEGELTAAAGKGKVPISTRPLITCFWVTKLTTRLGHTSDGEVSRGENMSILGPRIDISRMSPSVLQDTEIEEHLCSKFRCAKSSLSIVLRRFEARGG